MNHDLLKRVIYDQHEVISRMQIVPREYQLEPSANYVLTGLRRAGKSTMLYSIAQQLVANGATWDEITYVNFEDERLAEFKAADFDDIVAVQSEMCGGHGYFFLDEIQIIDGWERFARRLADAKERAFITGSNAKMLSREIEGALGGRYMSKRIDTYCFSEYLDAVGVSHTARDLQSTRGSAAILAQFDEYMQFGGFPESVFYENKREYASSVYQKVLLGDIVIRHGIRNANALKLLVKKIAESVRTDVSYSKLHHVLKSVGASISKDTVIDYVAFINESFLTFAVENYFAKFVDRESTPKYYFADNGLLNLFLYQKETALLENVVATHLRRAHPDGVFFLKSASTGVDVDFFVPDERLAVQVAYSLDESSYNREVGGLVKLARHFDETERYVVVTHEEERTIEVEGLKIEVVPAYKFLLEQTSSQA
ncbi:ATP-binding protein [Slackia heliotrinireducens]|uniref:ATP-binding protein n=1 Tax=Slackia heliotrinireducens TaxID=84110 RepID=UPI00331546D2